MKIISSKGFVAAVVLGLCSSVVAEEAQYVSATFKFSAGEFVSQLIENIDAAELGKSAVLYCQSEISVEGEASRTKCFNKEGRVSLSLAAQKSIDVLPFSSAEVDSTKVPVRMSYRVGINSVDDAVKAILIPNLGSMQERYGRDYIAPQERLDVSDWYGNYSKKSWVSGEAFLGEGELSRVAATVDEKGKAQNVRAVEASRAYKRDANIVKSALKKSRFIPGFVNDRPVSMGYLAVVNYAESHSVIGAR